jgi:amidase
VRRALKHAVEKLQQAGHEIVDWQPELHEEAVDLLVSERLIAVAVCR